MPATPDLDVGYLAGRAALLDPLDECVPCSVVRDGEAESVASLVHLNLLRLTKDVCKDEVVLEKKLAFSHMR